MSPSVRLPLAVLALLASAGVSAQQSPSRSRVVVSGSNDQSVTVNGSINNRAESGATAKVNIGSVSNASVGSNRQSVQVKGSIQNQASGSGSKAVVNIGSISDE
ncbi:hypothetical protein [Cognatilysobacter segetis]|uniref:hypothetical protein n=1 Tax=Cognatilysobacter segetis TaxID=2492394 RepID=UPI00105DC191|nr:hypothetical protein [Lysobacter segetis]